jgi:hypothetical protein
MELLQSPGNIGTEVVPKRVEPTLVLIVRLQNAEVVLDRMTGRNVAEIVQKSPQTGEYHDFRPLSHIRFVLVFVFPLSEQVISDSMKFSALIPDNLEQSLCNFQCAQAV